MNFGRLDSWSLYRANITRSQNPEFCKPGSAPPSRAPGCSYAPVAALSTGSSVSQGPPQNSPVTPHPGPPCPTYLGSWDGALPPARGVTGRLDLRNPFVLQGVELLHLRVSRYTLTLSPGEQLSWTGPTAKTSDAIHIRDAPEQFKSRYVENHFVLIEVCSVDILVTCLRIGTGFKGDPFRERERDASMRARCPGRQNCSHNVSQKIKRITHFPDHRSCQSWTAREPEVQNKGFPHAGLEAPETGRGREGQNNDLHSVDFPPLVWLLGI